MLAGVDSALVFDLGVYLKCQCVCAFFFCWADVAFFVPM